MANILIKINKELINYFGIPPRAKKLPEPLDMLIATILSQNTNDQNSFKAYQKLRERFPTWEDVSNARRISIEKEIKIAGLGFQKSSAIKNLLKELKVRNDSLTLDHLTQLNEIESIEYLTEFKGIGVKTASCVLLFSLNRNVCPVDTHVHRTLNRIGVVKTNAPDKTFFEINNNLTDGIAHSLHTNLIRLGREICKPKGMICSNCPLLKLCKFDKKNFEKTEKSVERSFMLLDNI